MFHSFVLYITCTNSEEVHIVSVSVQVLPLVPQLLSPFLAFPYRLCISVGSVFQNHTVPICLPHRSALICSIPSLHHNGHGHYEIRGNSYSDNRRFTPIRGFFPVSTFGAIRLHIRGTSIPHISRKSRSKVYVLRQSCYLSFDLICPGQRITIGMPKDSSLHETLIKPTMFSQVEALISSIELQSYFIQSVRFR